MEKIKIIALLAIYFGMLGLLVANRIVEKFKQYGVNDSRDRSVPNMGSDPDGESSKSKGNRNDGQKLCCGGRAGNFGGGCACNVR